jgi:hypothetical protein
MLSTAAAAASAAPPPLASAAAGAQQSLLSVLATTWLSTERGSSRSAFNDSFGTILGQREHVLGGLQGQQYGTDLVRVHRARRRGHQHPAT